MEQLIGEEWMPEDRQKTKIKEKQLKQYCQVALQLLHEHHERRLYKQFLKHKDMLTMVGLEQSERFVVSQERPLSILREAWEEYFRKIAKCVQLEEEDQKYNISKEVEQGLTSDRKHLKDALAGLQDLEVQPVRNKKFFSKLRQIQEKARSGKTNINEPFEKCILQRFQAYKLLKSSKAAEHKRMHQQITLLQLKISDQKAIKDNYSAQINKYKEKEYNQSEIIGENIFSPTSDHSQSVQHRKYYELKRQRELEREKKENDTEIIEREHRARLMEYFFWKKKA